MFGEGRLGRDLIQTHLCGREVRPSNLIGREEFHEYRYIFSMTALGILTICITPLALMEQQSLIKRLTHQNHMPPKRLPTDSLVPY